jgi:signal transduction histidine kinase
LRNKLMGSAARHPSKLLSTVVDSVRDGLFVMDAGCQIIWSNSHLDDMFGRRDAGHGMTASGFDAASLFSLSAAAFDEFERESSRLPEVLLQDVGQLRRLAGRHADGRTFPVELRVSGLQGSVGHYVVVVRDLSESARVAELERNFVSIVSHELRTPLTSVSGSLSLLAASETCRLSESGRRMLDIARRNVDRLNRLISDILDLEKLTLGQLVVHVEPAPLFPLLRDSIEMASGGCVAKQISISPILDPALDDNSLVIVDEDRFRQIMANLLSNALKFSPEGGEITVCAEAVDGDRVRVSVTDQGPGIPESFRDKIFLPFSQGENPSHRRAGGSGLGLSIVKSLVECMHGQVGFESTHGQGATFFVVLLRCNGIVGSPEGSA